VLDLDSFGLGWEVYDLSKELTKGEEVEPNEGDFEPF
jgi:hypothetical protein